MNKQWRDKWEIGERLGKGGQGLTYFAQSKADASGPYAIKFLKEQKVDERRERMYIEVSALKALQHPNIPKVVDSNEQSFRDLTEELYLVTELIPGSTLQEFLDKFGLMDLNSALSFALSLCQIIDFCHLKGFIHRDIKPDNIILRRDTIDDPVVIDFGLSFNKDLASEKNNTPAEQHIGNRFLSLPELRVSEGNKRDYRSDVTMISAILFFCLTRIHPTDLLDENQTKPHRRKNAREIMDKLESFKIPALNKFFDISFNIGIDDRWPSIASVQVFINNLITMKPEKDAEMSINQKLNKLKERIESREDFKQLQDIRALFVQCDKTIRSAQKVVIDKLKPTEFHTFQSGYNIDLPKQNFKNQLGIMSPFSKELSFLPKFTSYVTGSEMVLEAEEGENRKELTRTSLNQPIEWNNIQNTIEEYYIDGITNKES